MKTPDPGYAFGLPPRDAAAYLESLGCVPTESWDELLEEARAGAFTIARMTRMELLTEVKGILDMAMKNGLTMREFVKNLASELSRRGWTGKREKIDPKTGEVKEVGQSVPSRLKLIYFQNMQTAYMTGRYRAMLANAKRRPWWMYSAVLDMRTRPAHAALNGRVFRYDDPFWQKFYPPNGFYCRCTVRALDDEDLKRLGKEPESGEGHIISQEVIINPSAPEANWKTVERWGYRPPGMQGQTFYISPGFGWNPGYGTWAIDHVLAQKLDELKDDKLYMQVVEAINNSPSRWAFFGLWIKRMLKEEFPRGDAAVVGIVQPEVIRKAQSEGLEPARIAVITDSAVKHADRDAHEKAGIRLSGDQYANLAKNFANPEMVFWQKDHNNALYIFPDEDPDWCVVMPLNMPSTAKGSVKKLGRFDGVVTTYRTRREHLKDPRLERII